MDFFSILELVTSVVGVASMVATLTPNETDNKLTQVLLNFINFLGANFGAAKNK